MTDTPPASTRILGALRSEDGKGAVRMEDRIDTNVDDRWSALTDRSRLAEWYGDLDGELRLGGEYRAHLHASGRGMPVALLAAYGAGIQVRVEDLAAHVAGRDRCYANARWGELFPAYQKLAAAGD